MQAAHIRDRADRLAVWMLALGQMLGYACFFYLFAALILYWRQDLGWPDGTLAAGMTVAVVTSAVLAPFAGRAVDRGRVVLLLTGGVLVGALSLALLALARHPAGFLLAWAGLGVAQATCLYEPVFALMIRRFGPAARPAITRITLIGGLASTFAFPVAAWFADSAGWRAAVWAAFAAVLLLMLPLNLIGVRLLQRSMPDSRPAPPRSVADWRAMVFGRSFLGLSLVFSLVALDHWMILAFLRPMLAEMGLAAPVAIAAAATIGPAQVGGRLVLMALGDRMGSTAALMTTLACYAAAPLCLALAGVAAPLVFGFAALQGAANGIMTILRPLLVADQLGNGSFGTTAGLFLIPTLVASAIAPMLGAALMSLGGWPIMITAAGLCILAAMAVALVLRRTA